ncbi:baeRF2 domain-containing protein [Streptomyces sp. S186]|uniref:baeRF2 domain-containing protein n=1 Tax=Streptomyces sp. S186 TaxID=3434395 RepID=UPI003F661AA2
MRLTFLEPLYGQPGPFASVYVDTSQNDAQTDPDAVLALRWRRLRDTLVAEGADEDSISAVAASLGHDADVPGTHGQALFTAHGALALQGELPDPPARDTAHFGALPDTMPLIAQHAPEIPYLAGYVHYAGRHSLDAGGTVHVEAEAGRWPLTKVTPGERLDERVPVAEWPHAAERLGRWLAGRADRMGAEVLVLAGDTWARGILARRLPARLRGRVTAVDAGGAPRPGRALLEAAVERLFRGRPAAHDEALVGAFLAQRARRGAAAEGLAETVAALQRGQVGALLLTDRRRSAPPPLWVGPEPAHLALTEGELRSYGVGGVRPERADAALARALVGTGAELVLVSGRRLRLRDGVGALLRYADFPRAVAA